LIFDTKLQLLKTGLKSFLILTLSSLSLWIMSLGSSITTLNPKPIPYLVMDGVLAREGATKGGTTKSGKAWA